jgi:hypothetical protein
MRPTRILLTTGVFFILSPLWLFPLIHGLGVSIVTSRFKDQPVSFLEYDMNCVMIQAETDRFLLSFGLFVLAAGAAAYLLAKLRNRRFTAPR